VAIVVGMIAAFGLLNYVRNVEGAVYDNAEPETVWVVRTAIAKGTPIEQAVEQGMIEESLIPASYRPATAVVQPKTELAGLVAVTDLPENATLVQGYFVAPTVVNTGITDRLEEKDLVTLTFSVDQVKGAAYLIEPGDYVNILSVKPVVDEEEIEGEGEEAQPVATGSEDPYDYITRYVYQKVEVLAVDQALTPELGETSTEETQAAAAAPRNGGLITLAVPPEALPVVLSVGLENLYLSLVPQDYGPVPIPPTVHDDPVLPGEDDARLTPYGPEGITAVVEEQQ
jgi:Flp pilus assembly protein CpaB